MIGRGIFKNPWIFEKESVNHTFADVIKVAKAHVVLFQKTYKDKDFNILKKFFKMYIKDFDGASKLRSEIMNTKSIEEILYILTREEVKNL
jgi:tRNA-dihydrouridine synthase